MTAFFIPEDEWNDSSSSYEAGLSSDGSSSDSSDERRQVTGMSDKQVTSKTVQLEEVYHFTVEAPEDSTLNNGLEGLTVNDRNGHIFCTNEKEPREIIQLSAGGEQLEIRSPKYAEDLSGLCYDNELDLLWVLSDKSEA